MYFYKNKNIPKMENQQILKKNHQMKTV